MARRRFEHLHAELSVAVGELVPRYPLWLYLHAQGWDPEDLSREAAIRFAREHMEAFLAGYGWRLAPRASHRLLRTVERFDPSHPSPDEVMSRILTG